MSLNVNMENLTESERNQLLALVKKSTEEKPKVWKPKDEEEYYYIDDSGDVSCTYCNCCIVDDDRYAIGNCYRTREEAEFALEKLKVIAELKRFAQKHNEKIDWKNSDKKKYYLYYDYSANNIACKFKQYTRMSTIYFSSSEIAQQAIKAIGADRLKKYYFEVED